MIEQQEALEKCAISFVKRLCGCPIDENALFLAQSGNTEFLPLSPVWTIIDFCNHYVKIVSIYKVQLCAPCPVCDVCVIWCGFVWLVCFANRVANDVSATHCYGTDDAQWISNRMEMCWQSVTAPFFAMWLAASIRSRFWFSGRKIENHIVSYNQRKKKENAENTDCFLQCWCAAVRLLTHNLCQLWFHVNVCVCARIVCVTVYIGCVFWKPKNIGQCEKSCISLLPLICRYDNVSCNLGAFYRRKTDTPSERQSESHISMVIRIANIRLHWFEIGTCHDTCVRLLLPTHKDHAHKQAVMMKSGKHNWELHHNQWYTSPCLVHAQCALCTRTHTTSKGVRHTTKPQTFSNCCV